MNVLARILEPRQQIPADRKRFSNRALAGIVIPIIVEQFLLLLVGIVDTLMISYAGEAAVSGVSLIDQFVQVFIMVFTALAAGGGVVISQYIGASRPADGTRASGQMFMLLGVAGVVMCVWLVLAGDGVFDVLYGAAASDVAEAGKLYLFVSALSLPFLAAYNASAGVYRAMGRTKEIMWISFASNAINVAGNAIGIFALHAGVLGVAIPTLIARAAQAVAMTALAVRERPGNPVRVRVADTLAFDGPMLARICKLGIPGSFENGLFQLAKVALTIVVAQFGTQQIAANGVAQSYWSMAAVFTIALMPAYLTVVGQCMGSGDTEAAEYYARKLVRMNLVGCVVWNFALALLVPLFMNLYSLDPATKDLVIWLCVLHNAGNAFLAPFAFGLASAMRAGGDAQFNLWASMFSTVICRVALSVLFSIVLDMQVFGIVWAMIADWAIKSVLVAWRWRSGKWKNHRVI